MADEWQAKQMYELFRGSDLAHGEFTPTGYKGKKLDGKAFIVHSSPTVEMWLDHLNGDPPSLGIIPINADSQCHWGVIDVDDYELDFVDLLTKIRALPLICCKSKSGGAWLFLFCKQPIAAKTMIAYLQGFVSQLNLTSPEIFPKQGVIIPGSTGNFLNMPYYGATRYCIRLTGDTNTNGRGPLRELTLSEFIDYAYSKRVGNELWGKSYIDYSQSPIEDGPPCLQFMSINGFPEGTRNTSLLNIGVYLKKAQPDEWQAILRKYNEKLFTAPLENKEVETIIRSLDKGKDYRYQCHSEPLQTFCNATECYTRKYGIGDKDSLPLFINIIRIPGDDTVWIIETNKGRLTLSTIEFYKYDKFQMKCMSILGTLPPKMKAVQWESFVQSQIEKAVEIKESSMFASSELPSIFMQFVTSKLITSNKFEEVIENKVWYDEVNQQVIYRSESFFSFLKYRRIMLAKGLVQMFLKDKGLRPIDPKPGGRKTYRCNSVKITLDEEEQIKLRIGLVKGDIL